MNKVINPQKPPGLTVAMSQKNMLIHLLRYNAISTGIEITKPATVIL